MADLEKQIDTALRAVQHRPFLPKEVALKARHKKGIRLTRPKTSGELRTLASRPPRERASIERAYALRGKPDWVVDKLKLTERARVGIKAGHGLAYVEFPFWVAGHFSYDPSRRFYWTVPSVKDKRYDLTKAFIEPAALPFLGRTRSHGVE